MTDLTLNARQKKLLSILNARHNVETGKELAAKLGVSERTVRNDIREINSKLKQYEIQILPQYGKGYTISVNNREVYLQLFSEKANYETKEDRIRTMMLRLIRENDWYELGNLEDEMFVSRTTLESDIRAMRQRVSVRYPYLQIQRQGNYIKFEKDEIKRRALLIRLYAENWDYDSRDGIVLKQDEFGRERLEEIQNVFKDELYRCQTDLDDFGLIYMVLAIAVMQFRVNGGNTIEVFEKKGESQGIAAVVRYVLDALKELWQIELQENEYLWLSDLFYQIQILNTQNMTKAAVLGYTNPVCHKIVREMLQQVKDVYGLDFTMDDRLFADLCVHVQTLKNGIIAPQIQHHVFGDELRNRYPLLGDICHFLKNRLGQECEVLLGKDEEDYLLPFLISAQRTLYQKIRGKGLSTVVISHFNGSVTHFLMEQLQKFYGDILDLHGPYPVHGKERANQDEPMLIITTVRMKDFRRLFHAPMLTVSPLLDEEDQARLEHCLTDIKCKLLYPEKKRAIQDYIRPDMIYKMKNKDSLSSVIAAIQDRFYVKKYMVEKVAVDLENDYLAILPNGFVFMYQEDAYITDTVVSLVKLERAISWKHARNIRAIMFMALRPEDRTQLGWFYHLAFELAGNIQLLDSVIEKESLENLENVDKK